MFINPAFIRKLAPPGFMVPESASDPLAWLQSFGVVPDLIAKLSLAGSALGLNTNKALRPVHKVCVVVDESGKYQLAVNINDLCIWIFT